ncbi:MAG: alpha/beta hydrolase-fold protein [Planctomyces sp.]|jgi:poly(3-hydroxybutyrate) depolymerase
MARPIIFSIIPFLIVNLSGLTLAQDTPDSDHSKEKPTWVTQRINGPRISFHTFESTVLGTKVSYHLYTPTACDRDTKKRFPVVYWLHGSGGGLAGIPEVAEHFDAAIEAGKTPPCFVVFVNGLVEGMYVNWKDGSVPLETLIVSELVPHIDAAYPTIAGREGRLLDGYSMGGYGAARLGFRYHDLFRSVSIMGAGPLQAELIQAPRAGRKRAAELLDKVYGGDQEYFKSVSPRRLAEQNSQAISRSSHIRMVCGDQDETFAINLAFHEHLSRLSIPHTWTVLKGIDHNPMRTLKALGDSNWTFYREAFEQTGAAQSTNLPSDFETAFRVKQQNRRALIVNASTDGSKRPVVIALHGGQGSAEIMQVNSDFDRVARANGFMVVYGEGTSYGGNRHAWNTGFLLRRQVRDADDIAYLDTLIEKLITEYNADPDRICMTGGSNGGMMTFVYAVARSERLAAAAPVVASMFTFDKKPSSPLPILIINGGKDQEVPLEGGMSQNPLVRRAQTAPFKPLPEVVRFWVEVNRSETICQVSTKGTVTTSVYAATSNGAETEFVLDSVGSHGWPGSPSRRAGTEPVRSFSGAEKVWEFFKDKHR